MTGVETTAMTAATLRTQPGGVPKLGEPTIFTDKRKELEAAVAIDKQNSDSDQAAIDEINQNKNTLILVPSIQQPNPETAR